MKARKGYSSGIVVMNTLSVLTLMMSIHIVAMEVLCVVIVWTLVGVAMTQVLFVKINFLTLLHEEMESISVLCS